MIRLFTIDDHNLFREILVSVLKKVSDFKFLGESADADKAFEVIRKLNPKPDVVLMDIRMPKTDGLQATKRIKKAFPNVKVLGLTSCEDEFFASRLLDAGGSGYVNKSIDSEDLIDAIRKVSAGQVYLSHAIANQLAVNRELNPKQDGTFKGLSVREKQVALMVIQGKRPKEIAEALGRSDKTINTYRYRIYKKLQIKSDVALVRLAHERGLLTELGQTDEIDEV